jgi:hypothetical protein
MESGRSTRRDGASWLVMREMRENGQRVVVGEMQRRGRRGRRRKRVVGGAWEVREARAGGETRNWMDIYESSPKTQQQSPEYL